MAVSQSLAVTQESQNVAANTSRVRILWQSTQTGDSWNGYTRTAKYYVSVNGGAETEYSIAYTLPKGATKTILDVTITVAHKADGTGSVKVRTWMDTDISAGVVQLSKTLALDTIPRATQPTVSNNNVSMGSLIRINTPRASGNFTHDLAYSFAGGAYVSIATGVGTYYDWTTPDLASKIPSAASGTATIRCITKQGSTNIGTLYVTMTLRVPDSVVPSISAVSITEATAGLAAQFGAFVQSKSTLAVAITAAGAKGSTIKSYSTTFQGATYPGASWTSGALNSSGNLSMVTTVTDTRGRTAKKTTTVPGVLPYYAPEISQLQVYRTDAATGESDPNGTCMAVDLAYEVAPVGGKNTANMVLEYKLSTAATWNTLDIHTALSQEISTPYAWGFSTDYQYDVRATLTDWFGNKATYPAVPLPSGAVILDIAANGLGVGIGTTAQRAGLTLGWPTTPSGGFNPVLIPTDTDLDTVTVPNIYTGHGLWNYVNLPIAAGIHFLLEVQGDPGNARLIQRLTAMPDSIAQTAVYTRFLKIRSGESTWTPWQFQSGDSGWQNATLESKFALYTSTAPVQYRRSGCTVEVRGAIKPTAVVAYNDGWVTITTLPEGFRPGGSNAVRQICQGGGNSIFVLRVASTGAVQLSRYRNGYTNADIPVDTRLDFNVTFLTDVYF